MQNLILDNMSLVLLLPLWIFLIIICGRFFSVYVNRRLVYFLTLLSSFLGAAVSGAVYLKITEPIEFIYPFIKMNNFIISFGLQIDKLSLIMSCLLFIVSFAVQLFSVSYMDNDKKYYKFFAFLNLFNFAMTFLLFSPNLFQFYVFWELVGIVSYLLIGFDYKNIIKSEASRRVFLINRVGDTAFIAGIILISYYMYSYVENISFVTLSFEDFNAISTLLTAYTTTPQFCLLCGLFILAAAVKSAQFPFYTWLQDAMEAKLPVSALLHSATMVAAGVYLIIRMMPFFTLNQVLTNSILIIGILTAVICSVLASIETSPKKVLAYSTSANLGLMFMALGFMNIKAALLLLCIHAFIKSMLFVLLPKEQDLPRLNFIFFILSALSLSGLLFAGVGIKEMLFETVKWNQILSYIYMFVCFTTSFYIIRLTILLYKNARLSAEIKPAELISYLILFSGNALLYFIMFGTYHLAEPYAAAIGGLALAALLAKNNKLECINETPKILEKMYNNVVPVIYERIANFSDNIDKKILSNYKPILCLSKMFVGVINWTEVNVMNNYVNLISKISKNMSKGTKMLQSGNVQTYNAYAFIIVTIIVALLIIGYTVIFG